MHMNTRIITTGGTFDKVYAPKTGENTFDGTQVRAILAEGLVDTSTITIEELMAIDSLNMTDEHRDQLAQRIAASAESSIVVTHGTDTMPETARYLHRLGRQVGERAVVLTGAMRPYSFGNSDAPMNLASAVAYSRLLDPGVYVAMNGRYFDADNVLKDKALGIFTELQ